MRIERRCLLGLVGGTVLLLLIGGCCGPQDVDRSWSGSIRWEDSGQDGEITLALVQDGSSLPGDVTGALATAAGRDRLILGGRVSCRKVKLSLEEVRSAEGQTKTIAVVLEGDWVESTTAERLSGAGSLTIDGSKREFSWLVEAGLNDE